MDEAQVFFNFGPSFRNWVSILYKNIKGTVLSNGYMTKYFEPGRGVRQGFPLSVYLFILLAELLAIRLHNNNEIKWIKLDGHEIKYCS